jgi:BirA family biotin operon repressor/biotin-[acetyl-CoA-carboxylase] ligase
MQIWAHGSTVLGVGTAAPRAPLDKAAITALISQYWRVSVVELTASTQNDLSELLQAKSIESGEVLSTEFQSAGRGRLERTFVAPPKSALLFSFYISPKRPRSEWGFIAHLAAFTMHEVISAGLPVKASLKWPNDILIGEKKVAGLLAEARDEGVIVGLGINVAMTPEELPVDTATSLAIAGSQELDRNVILSKFLNRFEVNFAEWEAGSDFVESYSNVCATLGREIQIEVVGRENRTGVAKSIDRSGALILEDGFEVTVGDVVHLR